MKGMNESDVLFVAKIISVSSFKEGQLSSNPKTLIEAKVWGILRREGMAYIAVNSMFKEFQQNREFHLYNIATVKYLTQRIKDVIEGRQEFYAKNDVNQGYSIEVRGTLEAIEKILQDLLYY